MRKATLFLNVPNAKNFCFDFNSSKNRDNCFSSLILLKEFLQKNDIDLSTQDINSPENSEFVLFLDMPLQLPKARSKDKSFLTTVRWIFLEILERRMNSSSPRQE